uniref:Uncharacterized protein n=1 Tax=Stegastes partitus TaxID=144197 RepID=A0A3B5AHE6_9TELE
SAQLHDVSLLLYEFTLFSFMFLFMPDSISPPPPLCCWSLGVKKPSCQTLQSFRRRLSSPTPQKALSCSESRRMSSSDRKQTEDGQKATDDVFR